MDKPPTLNDALNDFLSAVYNHVDLGWFHGEEMVSVATSLEVIESNVEQIRKHINQSPVSGIGEE